MLPRATILRWTARGSLTDLQSSVEFMLKERKIRARVLKLGNSVVVSGPEPAFVRTIFENLPGVSWLAAGFTGGSLGELVNLSGSLARKYLRPRDRFSLEAEGTGRESSSDLASAVTSRILDLVKGIRTSAEAPKVRFRASLDGSRGAVGVELARGPGGIPTGHHSVTCFVSGGRHSSVVAWYAVLMGFRVRLVHAMTEEEGLLAVARLYSELSHRADPRWLRLEVLKTKSAEGALLAFTKKSKEWVFGGFVAGKSVPDPFGGGLLNPLYLLSEERFETEFRSLGFRSHDLALEWRGGSQVGYTPKEFGGVKADVSRVIDGLA